jgi:hypothetical protein
MNSTRRRFVLSDPDLAVRRWSLEAFAYKQFGNGVIFCSNAKDVNLYMRIVEGGTIPPFTRTRTFGDAISYHADVGATLDIMPIRSLQDASSLGTRRWPFMVFHNPSLWQDRTPVRLLLPHLAPAVGVRTTLISVGSALASSTDRAEPPSEKPKEIDWMAITRAISNG